MQEEAAALVKQQQEAADAELKAQVGSSMGGRVSACGRVETVPVLFHDTEPTNPSCLQAEQLRNALEAQSSAAKQITELAAQVEKLQVSNCSSWFCELCIDWSWRPGPYSTD